MRLYVKQNNTLKSVRAFSKKDLAPKYDPVFGNNSGATIKYAMQNQEMPSTGVVGDTKEFVGKDGNTYHAMLYDKQVGRYAYSDGSGRRTNGVIGFVELPNMQTLWNTTRTNIGGLADSQLRKNLNGLTGVQTKVNFMTLIIPDDLASLLEDVNIITSTGGTTFTGTSISANKLFPPCYINMKSTTEPQYVAEGTLWDYYAAHTADTDRRKMIVGTTTYVSYWTASPGLSYSDGTHYVNNGGDIRGSKYPNAAERVAPHWAW